MGIRETLRVKPVSQGREGVASGAVVGAPVVPAISSATVSGTSAGLIFNSATD